ncbi:SusC/RagA family TonB-linked outer membrane protein [Mucilaginibacter sp. RCC_168]|uniref:SusC/RagA family TonB-linked outer membrane protein n=1 Tax=Mucilaginibacter sp. RCC_168 TaxID=3239221 RepID=UPI00352549EE
MQLKNLLKVSCLAIFCFFAVPALAQNKVITGKVTDSHDGSPMPGVSIVAKGSTIGTNTGPDGSFKLSLPATNNTLVVSFIGYAKQEVDITGKTSINIALVGSATALSEVQIVSVGYGSQRRKDVTGAISSISAKDFNQGEATNPLTQLQGKVPGLVITNAGSDPTSTPTVRLRGQTSITGNQNPLVVLDGVLLDDPNQLRNIPPGDIASVDVLKDASAASIYGARGANGVLLVTTKKGREGGVSISYDGYTGIDKQSKYYDLLNRSEYLSAISALPNVTVSTYDKGGNTDWQKAVSRTAYTQSHAVAISGGANGFTYRGSVSYLNQQGVALNNDKNMLGLRFSAEQKALNNKLDINMGITYSRIKQNFNNVNYDWIFNTPPTYPVYNADGSYYSYSLEYNGHNPVQHAVKTLNNSYENLAILYASADYSIIPSLKIGVTGSTNPDHTQNNLFNPSFPTEGTVNNAKSSSYDANSYKGNIHINYDKTFGKHSVSATAVYEYNDYFTNNFTAYGENYLVPENQTDNLGGGNPQKSAITSNKTEYKLISFLARAQYNYDSRFYATASIRRDGSSKFGPNHEWGYFPAMDVAYRLKRDLVKNVEWIDDLKIRAGFGVTGNADAITPYSAIGLYGTGNTYYNPSDNSFPYKPSYQPSQNPNPDLKWERRQGTNVGINFSLFNNRLSGDVDFYNDKTKDLLYLYRVPTPPFLFNTILANVGSLSNKGVDIGLTGQPIIGKSFNWTVSGNITFVKTRITNLAGTYNGFNLAVDQIPLGNALGRGLSATPITYLKPGYAPFVFYLPHYTGVDANGQEQFDGQTVDKYPGGIPPSHYIDPSPKFNYGITNSFNYHNWSFNFFLRGVYGQKAFNNTFLQYETSTRLPSNNTTRAALTNGVKSAPTASDRWLEGASYLRMDNAALGYTFNKIKGINSLRVYVATNNLFVITKYRGLDPEISNAISYNPDPSNATPQNQSYIDNVPYPKTRSFVIGANFSLK